MLLTARRLLACCMLISLAGLTGLAGCGTTPGADKPRTAASAKPTSPYPSVPGVAVEVPAALPKTIGFMAPDILVQGQDSLPQATLAKIAKLPGVVRAEQLSIGSFYVGERQLKYAAVDPDTFRRFAPAGTGEALAVWQRVAGGEMAIESDLGNELADKDGYLQVGNEADAPRIHIGAYGDVLKPNEQGISAVNAVVNSKWGQKLGLASHNAVLVSTGANSPNKVYAAISKLLANRGAVQLLAHVYDTDTVQTAILTGGDIAQAVGTFRYTANADGSVNPDPSWIRDNIRSATVPILGTVQCHKVMLPQLQAALREIKQRGLDKYIHHQNGCFVPRYIGRSPGNGLSYHTFGTAIDIDAETNGRGTAGTMNPQVVQIFSKWGFTWGGLWKWTDPMHFELARLVKVG